ncbi:MAG TPA: carboxypeptidase regulatory-like domain-containing protein [Vicinamibacterales bacterium]
MRTILMLLFSASVAVSAQPPAPAAKPSAIIRGRILGINGRAARRASVRILAPTGGIPRNAVADADGRYEFRNVEAGDYRISASKPGFLVLEYGQQRAFEHGTVVTIKNGETIENVDITLPGGGAISGRVMDAHGDPVEGVSMVLMQMQFAANRRRLLPVAGVGRRLTNDQGQYRLYSVPPGQYVIMAALTNQRGAQGSVVLPSGYAPTYAPDTPNPAGARVVTVGLSAQIDDVNVMLAQVATSRIAGTVVDAFGKPLRARLLMSRSQRSGSVTMEEPAVDFSDADGGFEIRNVPAGDWVLQVSTGGDVNQGQEGEFVSRFVTVSGTDVTDLHLQSSVGSRIEGRIVFEGNGTGDATGVTVTPLPSDFDLAPFVGPWGRGTGRVDGTFTLNGLHGPRRLSLMRAPTPWMLKAIRVNGRDVTDEPLSFGTKDESLADVEVVLTSTAPGITGRVTGARGEVVADYTVIVFATAADRWYQGSRFLNFTRPKADGSFAVANLPPGDYYVAAVDRLQGTEGAGEWQDPAFLESIALRATRLTLNDGQQPSVTLRRIVR